MSRVFAAKPSRPAGPLDYGFQVTLKRCEVEQVALCSIAIISLAPPRRQEIAWLVGTTEMESEASGKGMKPGQHESRFAGESE